MIRSAVLRVLTQARHAAPRTGVVLAAASLAAPLADAASGDLDPAFADAGRLVLVNSGQVLSLELDEDGDGFLAGGSAHCHYFFGCGANGFARPFSSAQFGLRRLSSREPVPSRGSNPPSAVHSIPADSLTVRTPDYPVKEITTTSSRRRGK